MKTLRLQVIKHNNTRVEMYLLKDFFGSPHVVAIKTARLVDKKKREIKRTEEIYSLNTISMIATCWREIAKDDAIQDFLKNQSETRAYQYKQQES
jgi:hypothetical protein